MAFLPFLTGIVAGVFFALVVNQYRVRRRLHQLIWTIGIFLYSLTAFLEWLGEPDVLGANVELFRAYYILSAPVVGFLGAGTLILISPRRWGRIYLYVMLALTALLGVAGTTSAVETSAITEGFTNVARAYPLSVRVYAIIINISGALLLIGGSLFSFIRDRSRKYNLLIAAGAILPAVGGSLLGLGHTPFWFVLELLGTILLFMGFLMSSWQRKVDVGTTSITQQNNSIGTEAGQTR